jgi:hypothetical protein
MVVVGTMEQVGDQTESLMCPMWGQRIDNSCKTSGRGEGDKRKERKGDGRPF